LICRWLLWRGIKTFISPQTLANSDCPAGAATGPMSYSVGSLRPNGGDELFVKLARLVYAGGFAFLNTAERTRFGPFFFFLIGKPSNQTER